jgi:hypothetical protein
LYEGRKSKERKLRGEKDIKERAGGEGERGGVQKEGGAVSRKSLLPLTFL